MTVFAQSSIPRAQNVLGTEWAPTHLLSKWISNTQHYGPALGHTVGALCGQLWYETVALGMVSEGEHVVHQSSSTDYIRVQVDTRCKSLFLCFALWRGTIITPSQLPMGIL